MSKKQSFFEMQGSPFALYRYVSSTCLWGAGAVLRFFDELGI